MSEFFLGVNARTSPNDMQSPGSETIYLYDSSELNRECLTSLEHKLDHEDIVCIPTEQLQQINIMFGELSEQHQRTALYLEQLGSLLSKLNHDAHLQLTNDKVPIEFSNGVGGQEATAGINSHSLTLELDGLELEDHGSTLPATANQKNTILIVDDSRTVRQALSLTLETDGYHVKAAEDGRDALEQLLSGLQVGAIICDLDMPRLDGYGLLTRLKSDPALKHFPIAMLTSHTEDKHRQRATFLGAAAYFTKPYNEQELLKTLKELIK